MSPTADEQPAGGSRSESATNKSPVTRKMYRIRSNCAARNPALFVCWIRVGSRQLLLLRPRVRDAGGHPYVQTRRFWANVCGMLNATGNSRRTNVRIAPYGAYKPLNKCWRHTKVAHQAAASRCIKDRPNTYRQMPGIQCLYRRSHPHLDRPAATAVHWPALIRYCWPGGLACTTIGG